ncbi:uncharacterized protein K452DRAFT_306498 [Aplosporella prunicola CBS 121167]|uniref:PH domain-containing protein n=1 Tax=Aplosporella prunicola CBS 121167 TaxID=1176127 RepID=A0A6A6BKU0_9PEZI|nr:uncharacterized protein K452DRAFT_306498 [Aplosporella prunicola CBS 121167]KAF2144719.1 hypothetical protein K452DRAFT_306498 [Aplosporella prunicola CBS 121167]
MAYNPVPAPSADHLARGYGAADFAPAPAHASDPQHPGRFNEEFDDPVGDGDLPNRSTSRASSHTLNQGGVSRSGTLKKKNSLNRKSSLKRSGSRRSMAAGSIKGVAVQHEGDLHSPNNFNSVFHTPVPTQGTPTDILANRFQAWRKLLKDLITYFREVQSSYEHRSKALMKVSNVINNLSAPSDFLTDGGLNDATRILRDYHKQSVIEANKARDIENDVIAQLSGLRNDLGNKIKEIKGLSGDFKNSVDKEKENTRKAIAQLGDALAAVEVDPHAASGKGDPFVVRLAVDRQVEKQIDEENYLHRAYLNLEGSGRELESIVVGEVQKAYNALAGILKRDADEAYNAVERLRAGPVSMPKDLEWSQFVQNDPHFVNPRTPLRRVEDIEYPGKHHSAAVEIRAGMLERKSKYLKSYTPGWYVLSPTHLHEFKSADRIYSQPPVMSLYLPEQKLGTHSQLGSSSQKFILKGRQAGSMHRGHTWVFRAESYDTMLAWYEDIKTLTEKTGEERNAFVRNHARSVSAGSARSVSSDGLEDNEADEVPYSAADSVTSKDPNPAPRPQPGGRFPSDLQVNHHLQAPLSPSSGSSEADFDDLTTAAGGLQGNHYPYEPDHHASVSSPVAAQQQQQHATAAPSNYPPQQQYADPPYAEPQYAEQRFPVSQQSYSPVSPVNDAQQQQYPVAHQMDGAYQQAYPMGSEQVSSIQPPPATRHEPDLQRHDSRYGSWMTPAAGGAAAGIVGAEAYRHYNQQHEHERQPDELAELAGVDNATEPARQGAFSSAIPSQQNSSLAYPDMPATADATSNPSMMMNTADAPDYVAPARATESPAAIFANAAAANANGTRGFPDADAHAAVSGDAKANAHAHPTGGIFPAVLRHDTDVSISQLHVPGEYPRTPGTSGLPPVLKEG